MSNNSILEPDDLVYALVSACQEYTDDIISEVETGLTEIGEEATKEVKQLAPVYDGTDQKTKKGSYRRSWTYTVEKSRGTFNVTVHVKGKNYRLTHLLENGHLNRDGTTRARAIPHISIANEHAQKKAEKLLEEL